MSNILFIYGVILIIFVVLYSSKRYYKKWYQCKNIDEVLKIALIKKGYNRTYDNNWDVYIPCKYGNKYINKINISRSEQIPFVIYNNNILGSKKLLWKYLVKYYGRDIASNIMPASYIFPDDKKIFDKEFKFNKYYIKKKETQRQTGLYITNNYNEIIKTDDKYIITQEFIDNPLCYKGFKINVRIYLLVICDGYNSNGYIFDDGIISYAKNIKQNSVTFDTDISSFYTSTNLYDKGFPITIKQMMKETKYINWYNLYDKFKKMTNKILNALSKNICMNSYGYNNKGVQLFGIDFMITNNYKIYVMEINIGPGMTPYNNIDKEMRIKLHYDMLTLIGINNDNDRNDTLKNGFIKLSD